MIELKETEKGFSLSYKNRDIIKHEKKRPCLYLGIGEGSYKMSHSHFKIRDRVKSRVPMKEWSVKKNSPDEAVIGFGDSVKMKCAVNEGRLAISFSGIDSAINRFWLSICADKSEHIYGCGEQYTYLDLRGKNVPLWVQEQGVGRGKDLITLLANVHSDAGGSWFNTYYPQPTFVSSAHYFCHVDTTSYAEFDFRKKDLHTLHVWDIPSSIIIDVKDTALEVLDDLSSLLGRQPKLPEWAYDGIWLGMQGGKDIVEDKVQKARAAGIKIAALWCQDWEGIRMTAFGKQLMWEWTYDRDLYPDLPGYIKDLNSRGIKFMGYINPMLAPEKEMYREADEKGYLVKNEDGSTYQVVITTFPVGVLDFTNPEAVEWCKDIIKKEMIDIGLSGWMADYAEVLQVDGKLHSGESGEKVHNEYPVQWAKVNRDAIEEAGRLGDIVFFMRSGYSGSSRYSTAFWAGDQLVNWSMDDGLATVIPAAISLGFCGIGQFHSDIGGFTTVAWIKRSKELLMRWLDMAVFMPTMRSHEGSRPYDNWQYDSDEETLQHFARMTCVYADLKEYHLHAENEYVETGVPPIRHPYIHYGNDEVLHSLRYQYLYGRDLMAAPVYKKGKKSHKVYLPDDRWVHLWSGEEYGKGWHRVKAPIGEPPVFYRAGSEFKGLFEKFKK